MKFYDIPEKVTFPLRLAEGLSTGTMTMAYLYNGKWNWSSFFVYLIHWGHSIQFHLTYEESHKHQDQLWIQFLCCERLGFCNPRMSFFLRFFCLPLFNKKIGINEKTLMISSFSCLIHFLALFFFYNTGVGFALWMILTGILYFFNDPCLLNYAFGWSLDTRKRSSILCILFHLGLGMAQLNDGANEKCSHIQLFYYEKWNVLFYFLCFFTFGILNLF